MGSSAGALDAGLKEGTHGQHHHHKTEPRPSSGSRLHHRAVLTATAGLGAIAMVGVQAHEFGRGVAPIRYPAPDIVVIDKRFKAKHVNAAIQRLYTGTRWFEGPAENGVGRYLIWSDIGRNEQRRSIEEDGHVSRRFRSPANNSNGNTFDFQGRQIACEHFTRRVVRYEHNGKVTVLAVLAESFQKRGFNAPNDAVVHPNDGAIWFTDPGYGSLMEYEDNRLPQSANSPQPSMKEAVYRIAGQTGAITKVTDEPFKPNGLCFSHDYCTLYVADNGRSHYPEQKSQIWVFDIDGTTLKNGKMFVNMECDGKIGMAEGIRCDEDGNVYAGARWVGDGYDGP